MAFVELRSGEILEAVVRADVVPPLQADPNPVIATWVESGADAKKFVAHTTVHASLDPADATLEVLGGEPAVSAVIGVPVITKHGRSFPVTISVALGQSEASRYVTLGVRMRAASASTEALPISVLLERPVALRAEPKLLIIRAGGVEPATVAVFLHAKDGTPVGNIDISSEPEGSLEVQRQADDILKVSIRRTASGHAELRIRRSEEVLEVPVLVVHGDK